jgi:hypothetical protein
MSNVKAQGPNEYRIVEEWNIGMLEISKEIVYFTSLFHHSSVPLFQTYFSFPR